MHQTHDAALIMAMQVDTKCNRLYSELISMHNMHTLLVVALACDCSKCTAVLAVEGKGDSRQKKRAPIRYI